MRPALRVLTFPLLLFACSIAVSAERAIPSAAWSYQFPGGIVDYSAMRLTPDLRYLAVSTGRWTRDGSEGVETATSEGENAVYVFDLEGKRLLSKQLFSNETAASVVGFTPSGGIAAIRVGASSAKETTVRVRLQEGMTVTEGVRVLGPSEAGVRLYASTGELLATGAPMGCLSGPAPYLSALVLRPTADGEAAIPDSLRRTLTEAGVATVTKLASRSAYGFAESAGKKYIASFSGDGTEQWRWDLPDEEARLDREWRAFAVSPDLEYAMASLTPYAGSCPSGVRHLYLFSRRSGLLWQSQVSMAIPSTYGARSVGLQVSNGAKSVLVVRVGPRGAVADARDRSGAVRRSWEFGDTQPAAYSLSPNGRYWAAALRQTWQGKTDAARGWTAGIHVFDCETGEVVWCSPVMADAAYVIATDTGGVVAVSPATRTLAVFGPQL